MIEVCRCTYCQYISSLQKRDMTASTVLLTIVLICLLCHSLKTCLNIVELVISFQVQLAITNILRFQNHGLVIVM